MSVWINKTYKLHPKLLCFPKFCSNIHPSALISIIPFLNPYILISVHRNVVQNAMLHITDHSLIKWTAQLITQQLNNFHASINVKYRLKQTLHLIFACHGDIWLELLWRYNEVQITDGNNKFDHWNEAPICGTYLRLCCIMVVIYLIWRRWCCFTFRQPIKSIYIYLYKEQYSSTYSLSLYSHHDSLI